MARAGRLLRSDGPAAAQHVEVPPCVRLEHVIEVDPAVAADEVWRRRRPRRAAPRELLVAHAERERPLRHVELDRVAGADERERSEEHTSELQSRLHLVCRLLLEKKKKKENNTRV